MVRRKEFLVTIPYYNKSEFIDRCLKSLERQISINFDVLIVDDGSTNEEYIKLLESILKYSQRGLSIDVVRNDTNRGLFYSRWVGFTKAKERNYKWVLPLDPDDALTSHCIEELDLCQAKDDKLDVMYFEIACIYPNFVEVYDFENFWTPSSTLKEVYEDENQFRSPFMLCTKVDFLDKVYPSEQVMSDFPRLVYQEDCLLTGMALTSMNPKIYFIPELLYNYYCDTGVSCINKFAEDKDYKVECLLQLENAFTYLYEKGYKVLGYKDLRDVYIRYEKDFNECLNRHSNIYDVLGEL